MKNKILFILHLSPPFHGASSVGDNIFYCRNINQLFSCKYINLSLSNNLQEIGLLNFTKIYRYIVLICSLIKYLFLFNPNLVYITLNTKGSGFYKDSIIAIIAKLFRKNLVLHFHNKGISARHDYFIDNILYKIVLNYSSIILLSPLLYNDIKKYVRINDIYICPNGINKFNLNFNYNRTPKTLVNILFFSNLLYSKGLIILLEACSILCNDKISFHCTIAGCEGDINKIQLEKILIKYNLINYISYVGPKFNNDKFLVFNSADIFVLPTLEDCFPLVILEAMQSSLPVIATDEGGISDIVDDGITGFIIPKNDSLILADKLKILIQNNIMRIDMGLAGKKKYKNNFTISHFENKLTNIFNQIIK